MGEYFLIVLAFWWQWILIIRDPHANMYYLLRSPNNLNHLYVHTPTLMWSDYHWQMLSQHSSFISKCEEKQKVASERKWCSYCFAKIMLVKMIEVIFLPTLLCGCNVIGIIEVFLTKKQMLQLNVQCWWLWRSLVFAQYQALPMHWRKPQTNLRSVESPSQLSCMSKDLPVCSMEKKMLNIWKTIAGKSADQNPAIYFFISIWNIRENFSPRLVAPGRLWSPWEAPSSPHLAPGGCLEGQPPEDRLAMILKKKTFSWSRPSPSFQLIKTWTKSSTVILSNPLSFTTSLQASFTCTYLLSAQGERFCRSCLIFPSTFFQFNCKL